MDLCGKWNLCYDNTSIVVEVPGVIEKYVDKKDEKYDYYYSRTFKLDKKENKNYILNCEGISYGYIIFINGKEVIKYEGIWEHLKVDVTKYLEKENKIEIKIIRPNFEKESPYFYRSLLLGFIPDVLLPFSGIFRPIYIDEKNVSYIEDCRVFADYDNNQFVIDCKGKNLTNCEVSVNVVNPNKEVTVCKSNNTKFNIPVDVIKWSTSQPNLYTVEVNLCKDDEILDTYTCKRGFRKIKIEEEKILINGEREYFRGILHWGYYPEEMSFTTSKEKIYKEVMMLKEQGFNAVKFCLFIPDKYYFQLCDELGILVWQELPLWLPYDNGYLYDRIEKQYPKMMKNFIDNPSTFLVSIGCEMDATVPQEQINRIYDNIKSYNSTAIICDNSGSGECFEGNTDNKTDIYDYHFYPEINNMQNLIDAFNHESRDKKPWLFGEYNDMDSFRNLKTIVKKFGKKPFWASSEYSENLLRYVHQGFGSDNPVYYFDDIVSKYNYENLLEELEKIGLEKAYDIRKYNLETTRSNDSISGYSITAIRDVPITSCGIVDDFGSPKFSNEKMNMINGNIVITMLPKLGRQWYRGSDIYDRKDIFNFENGSYINNRIVISNHLSKNFIGVLSTKLLDENNQEVFNSEMPIEVKGNKSKYYSDLSIKLEESNEIKRYTLEINFNGNTNKWDIWGYPKAYNTPKFYIFDNMNMFEKLEDTFDCEYINDFNDLKNCIFVTTVYNEEVKKLRNKGVKILYIQNSNGYYSFDYVPFWRENVKYIQKNMYLDELKHKGYDGLNFISLTTNIGFDSCKVKEQYPNYNSLIKRIDNRNFKTHEIIFEVNDEKEKMIVTSFDFSGGKGSQSRSFESNYLAKGLLDKLVKIIGA